MTNYLKLQKKTVDSKDATFEERLKKLDRKNFDGHTEFRKHSYGQRLMSLSQAVIFPQKYSKTKESVEISTQNSDGE